LIDSRLLTNDCRLLISPAAPPASAGFLRINPAEPDDPSDITTAQANDDDEEEVDIERSQLPILAMVNRSEPVPAGGR
jgi:hypothetical protein